MESLVSTTWLEAELGAPDLRVVDDTLFLPGRVATPRRNSRPATRGRGLPRLEECTTAIRAANAPPANCSQRIQYSGSATATHMSTKNRLHSAARTVDDAHPTERAGALLTAACRMDAEGRPLESASRGPPRPFTARGCQTVAKRRTCSDDRRCGQEIVDARGQARFAGEEADQARPRAGHIPARRICSRPPVRSGTIDGSARALRAASRIRNRLSRPMVRHEVWSTAAVTHLGATCSARRMCGYTTAAGRMGRRSGHTKAVGAAEPQAERAGPGCRGRPPREGTQGS